MPIYIKPLDTLIISPHLEYSKVRLHTGPHPRPTVTIFEKYKTSKIITISELTSIYDIDFIIDEISENTFLIKDGSIITIKSESYYGKLFGQILNLKSTVTLSQYISKYQNNWYRMLKQKFKPLSITDHLGNHFNNQTDMALYHNCKPNILNYYLKKKPIKEAIELAQKANTMNIIDHKGHPFETLTQMCQHHGITLTCYERRKKKGWALKKILTTPARKPKQKMKPILYNGHTYPSMTDFCKNHNISVSKYQRGIKLGKSLEQIINDNDSETSCNDHLGNSYPNIKQLCETYNIPRHTYNKRRRKNWSLEKTLMTPTKKYNRS